MRYTPTPTEKRRLLTESLKVYVWVVGWCGERPRRRHTDSITDKCQGGPDIVPPKPSDVVSKPESK